jgi:hypothetical protein
VVTVDEQAWSRSLEDHFHSPAYGVKQSHKALHFAARATLPTEFVSLLIPFSEVAPPEGSLAKISASSDACVGYRYLASAGEHCFFFGEGSSWKMDSWSTDAEFLYVGRFFEGASINLVCCNASFVEWNGHKIMTTKSRVLRCELGEGDPVNVISSDLDAVTIDSEAWKALLNSSRQPVKMI